MCCKPLLLPYPWTQANPHTDTGREDFVLWQGLRSESMADTAPAAHISYYAYHSSNSSSELSALSTQFLLKKHQHCKSRASTGALFIYSLCASNSLLKQSTGVVQINDSNKQLKHTHHCMGWGSTHYHLLFCDSTRWPDPFSFLAVRTKQRANNPKPCLEPKVESEWCNRGLEKPRQGCFLSFLFFSSFLKHKTNSIYHENNWTGSLEILYETSKYHCSHRSCSVLVAPTTIRHFKITH